MNEAQYFEQFRGDEPTHMFHENAYGQLIRTRIYGRSFIDDLMPLVEIYRGVRVVIDPTLGPDEWYFTSDLRRPHGNNDY